jgi:hypothetical protein
MWLKTTGVTPPVMSLQRQFGPYVPVSIMHGDTPSEPPLYWRLMDPEFNLVEIGIDRRDGHFVSFTLFFCKEVVRTLSQAGETVGQAFLPVPKTDWKVRPAAPGGESFGVPVFSLDPWTAALASDPEIQTFQTRLHDVAGRCRLELGNNAVRVVLSSDEINQRVVTDGGLIWEFNASAELRSALFPNITQQDKTLIEESLRNLGTLGI